MTTRRCLRRSILPILALILFGLFLTSPDVLHAHGAGGLLGLYNAECPLAEVAARHGVASLPSVPAIVATWWTVGPAPAAVVALVPSPFARHTDSRAPPLA